MSGGLREVMAAPLLIFFIVVVLAILLRLIPIRLYLVAKAASLDLSLAAIIVMRLRRIRPDAIINPLIMATQAGVPVNRAQLEAHYLAKGNVANTVQAVVSARAAGVPLSYDRAMAIDLSGRDAFEAVRSSFVPKILDCPQQGRGHDMVEAAAQDGVRLRVKARLMVRTKLERLVGGGNEEMLVTRVGEAIMAMIRSVQSHEDILQNPAQIAQKLLAKKLDSGTAFEIISIDVTDAKV